MAKAEIKEPAAGKTALILIDMVNHLDFEGASDMEAAAKKAAERILLLRDEADRLGVPIVYVNDNFGQWHSERSKLVAHATSEGRPGREMVRRSAPRDNDFFVIKPQAPLFILFSY